MSSSNNLVMPPPVADSEAFKAECSAMLEWLGTIDMPEEKVGLREAAGNIGGILINMMQMSKADFFAEEATNVATLSGYLKTQNENENRTRILETIFECAAKARDEDTDLNVEFR